MQGIVRKENETESFVVGFCSVVLGVNKQADATSGVEYFDELIHRGDKKQFAEALALAFLRDGEASQFYSGDFARQPARDFRRKLFRPELADVQGEVARDGLWFASGFLHQHKCSRDAALRVLTRGLPEVGVERFATAIKTVPVVSARKKFELKHAPVRGRL